MISIKNTFSFTRKISSLFNKRKRTVIFSDPLLWVENGLLQYDDYHVVVKTMIKSMEDILENNNKFDDQLFKALYDRYTKNYYVYDHYPYLLTIDMIKLASSEFRLSISDEIYFTKLNPTQEIYDSIPKLFKLPTLIEDDLITLLERVRTYLNKYISTEYYTSLIRMEYLSRWESIYKYQSNAEALGDILQPFLFNQQEFLISLAEGDNKTTVSNIIVRFWENKKNTISN